jgi:hypothetical protein
MSSVAGADALSTLGEAALALAAQGFAVFRLSPGTKKPLKGSNGFKDATTDPEQIRGWWKKTPNANIGVATGASRLIVIDGDVKHGDDPVDSLLQLKNGHNFLPETLRSATTSDGWHLYFRAPEGIEIRNSVGELGPGLDVRGEGGYVVAPPSVVDGKSYRWINGIDEPVAQLPDWLIEAIGESSGKGGTAPAAVNDAGHPLGGVPEGGRDEALFKYACSLQSRGMPKPEAMVLIERAATNCDPPFDLAVARSKVESAYQRYAKPVSGVATTSRVVTVLASEVAPEPINWLWPGRIARGKSTMVAGDPGLGKSLLTLALAAVVTTGGLWPVTRERCERSSVLLLSAEDDIADTIRPRLDAAGADCTRIRIVQAVETFNAKRGEFTETMFSLRWDLEALDSVLAEMGDCGLIIIDPVTAYLDGADSHKNAEVRALLAPLSKLASKWRAALVAVTHLNKGSGGPTAMHRFTGSLAFVAAARAAYVAMEDKADPTRRLLLPAKNNLAEDITGFAYRVRADDNGVARIEWEPELVTISADELLTDAAPKPLKRDAAEDWLCELLAEGAMLVDEVKRRAGQAGFSWATIRSAKSRLGIDPAKKGFREGWTWSLPEDF